MKLFPTLLPLLAFLSAAVAPIRAEIRLPGLLTNEAVLQRNAPIHLWGWSSPDATLTLTFHRQTLHTTANTLGAWNAWLTPEPAGGPYTLTIDGGPREGKKVVDDILVGDVWIASGQSNMQFPLNGFPPTAHLKNGPQEIAAATNPNLRLLLVADKSSDFPLTDVNGHWTQCTPATASQFSAIAYFFGREIAADQHVPIGLIDASWGGTPVDSWISLNAFGSNPALLPAIANRAGFADQQGDLDQKIASEKAADEAARAAGQPLPSHPWHPFEDSWLPAGLYNGMIAPLTPESVKGFLWYQGETDSSPARAPHYSVLFPALIQDWRTHFQQGNLPFLYVQISSFHSPGEIWGEIRDAQRRTLFLANTAMAVSLDVGDPNNVHPADKQTVAARLALAARGLVYRERVDGEPIAYASPLFRQATTQLTATGTGAMRVWFDHAEGLTSRSPLNPASGESTAGGSLPAGGSESILGFELAGPDHHFIPATATIQGETVLVSAPTLPNPRFVRYDWSNVVPGSLYNSAGLPAATFTSEDLYQMH
jgi:sialate O-acetylesterase